MRRMLAPRQAAVSPARTGGIGMSLGVKRSVAAVTRLLRKAIPARGWRRYATGGLVVSLAGFGTVTAVNVLPAQAAHSAPAQTASGGCLPPTSPTLAGFRQ